MRKRLGVVLSEGPDRGGVYQYSTSVMNALNTLDGRSYDISVFYGHRSWQKYMSAAAKNDQTWVRYNIPFDFPIRALGRSLRLVDRKERLWRLYKFLHPLYYHMRLASLDLVIYPIPVTQSFEIGKPYIIAVHDLQHRLHPEFPEVSARGEWRLREYLFRNACEHAVGVLVDSNAGKQDVLRFYNVNPERVHVLPFVPPSYLRTTHGTDVREKYGLPDRFLFYPAQFWLHKNHKGLVDALHLLKKDRGIEVPVVFVGSKKNAHKELSRRISGLGLSKQVFNLGYVPDEEMVGLYRSACALVMPTFFGPTNIPQLEAFLLGCPVITSRLPGIDEQVGDAAILVDPYSAGSIAEGISRIWENETLREVLVQKGYRRSMLWTQENFNGAFRKILDNAFSSLKGA